MDVVDEADDVLREVDVIGTAEDVLDVDEADDVLEEVDVIGTAEDVLDVDEADDVLEGVDVTVSKKQAEMLLPSRTF